MSGTFLHIVKLNKDDVLHAIERFGPPERPATEEVMEEKKNSFKPKAIGAVQVLTVLPIEVKNILKPTTISMSNHTKPAPPKPAPKPHAAVLLQRRARSASPCPPPYDRTVSQCSDNDEDYIVMKPIRKTSLEAAYQKPLVRNTKVLLPSGSVDSAQTRLDLLHDIYTLNSSPTSSSRNSCCSEFEDEYVYSFTTSVTPDRVSVNYSNSSPTLNGILSDDIHYANSPPLPRKRSRKVSAPPKFSLATKTRQAVTTEGGMSSSCSAKILPLQQQARSTSVSSQLTKRVPSFEDLLTLETPLIHRTSQLPIGAASYEPKDTSSRKVITRHDFNLSGMTCGCFDYV